VAGLVPKNETLAKNALNVQRRKTTIKLKGEIYTHFELSVSYCMVLHSKRKLRVTYTGFRAQEYPVSRNNTN